MVKTQRLLFTELGPQDERFVRELYADKLNRAYLGGVLTGEAFEKRFKTFLEDDDTHWVVQRKDDVPIGLVSLGVDPDTKMDEVSYQFLSVFWGQGYAQEALAHFLEQVFPARGIAKLYAETQQKNKRSVKLLEKLGFKPQQTLKRHGEIQAVFHKDLKVDLKAWILDFY